LAFIAPVHLRYSSGCKPYPGLRDEKDIGSGDSVAGYSFFWKENFSMTGKNINLVVCL